MTIVSILNLTFHVNAAEDGLAALLDSLRDTRAFDGCIDVEVLVEQGSPHHVVLVEQWASREQDQRYRDWRASTAEANPVAALLATPPSMNYFDVRA